MAKYNIKFVGCISVVAGVLLAIYIPAMLFGAHLTVYSKWFWLAPGWAIFQPGRDDGAEILLASLLNIIIYFILILFFIYLLSRSSTKG